MPTEDVDDLQSTDPVALVLADAFRTAGIAAALGVFAASGVIATIVSACHAWS